MRLRAQTDFDIAQTLPAGQLGIGHAQRLVQVPEGAHVEVAGILGHQSPKRMPRRTSSLGEHEIADMHEHLPDKSEKPTVTAVHGVQIIYAPKHGEGHIRSDYCWLVSVNLSDTADPCSLSNSVETSRLSLRYILEFSETSVL